jgi:hypothetical protein
MSTGGGLGTDGRYQRLIGFSVYRAVGTRAVSLARARAGESNGCEPVTICRDYPGAYRLLHAVLLRSSVLGIQTHPFPLIRNYSFSRFSVFPR